MSDEHIRQLAAKFLKNEASDKEIKTLMDWYASFQTEEELTIHADTPGEEEAIRTRIHSSLMAHIENTTKPRVRSIPLYRRPWAAAAILALIGASWLYYTTHSNNNIKNNLVELKVPRTGRQKILLPDSSVVWVNADSRISYAAGFSHSSREVFLEGEAFFDVRPDAARAFIVHTAHATTKVLGTAFDVKAYNGDGKVCVTVLKGKVEVTDMHRHTQQISPNQQALIDIPSGQLIGKTVAAEAYQAWTRGALEFNGESFEEVARILNRKYGVNIHFENEALAKCTFLATFEDNDSIVKVIELLCKINNSSFHMDGNNDITISGKGCN